MPHAENELVRYGHFIERYRQETDRAAAVLAGSYVDSLLGRVLVRYLVDDVEKIHSFSTGYGPLASFSARIDLLYLQGLLPARNHRDLHAIRRIRNHVAHHEGETSFDASPVRDWVAQLSIKDSLPGDYPNRHTFLIAIGELAWGLTTLIKHSVHRVVPEFLDIDPNP
jgi:hypothetical protein